MKQKKDTISGKQQELSDIMGSKNSTLKNKSEEFELREVDDTPFMIIREGDWWYVIMGKYRITDAIESKERAIQKAHEITWNKIVTVMSIMLETKDEIIEEVRKN